MLLKHQLFIIIFSSLLSCQNQGTTISLAKLDKKNINQISVNPENSTEILASQIYHQLHYIPLETNFNSLVDADHKTKIFDNFIGVLNINYNNFILFDRQGNYILNVGSKGKHPGNLSTTYDFTIINNRIYFPSHGNKSLSIYNVNGEYKKTFILNNSYEGMRRTEDLIVLTSKNLPNRFNSKNENLALYDKEVTKILNFGNVPKYLEYIDSYDIIYKSYSNNEIIYHQILSDTIFRINNEKEVSYILIQNYPPLKIAAEDQKVAFNMQNGLFDKYMHNTKATYPTRNIYDSENYMLLFYMYDYQHYVTIYSKSDGISKTFHFDSDDMRNHVFHPSMDYTALDNTMLIETTIQDLRRVVSFLPEDYLAVTNVDAILNNPDLNENSNPIILTYKLNEEYVDSLFSEKN